MTNKKSALRARMRTERRTIPPLEAQAAAQRAAKHLLELEAVRSARTVALYAPVRGEIGTEPADAGLRAMGKRLAYPRIVPNARRLKFHIVDDLAFLRPGQFGIYEPDESLPLIEPHQLDAVVLPGLAFDLSGGRLGWGGGFYDRSLSETPEVVKVGFAFEAQLIEIVPVDESDVRMDCVITEEGARECVLRDPFA
jgi:5-formyltetrahydrofolate cyclo-ligase